MLYKPYALIFEHGKYFYLESEEEFETIIEKKGVPLAMKPKKLKIKVHIFSRDQFVNS